MSAPPGYNETASMLPDGGGAIRAMHGGFSASPYSGGVTETNSLIKDVSAAVAPISSYSGGNRNADIPIAIATTSVASLPPAASPVASPIASQAASQAASPEVLQEVLPIAVSISALSADKAASAAPLPSTSAAPSAEDLSFNNNSYDSVAVFHASELFNANATAALTNLGRAASAVNGPNKGNTPTNKPLTSTEDADNNDDGKKDITIYGKVYRVGPPAENPNDWNTLMEHLGLDELPLEDQKEFKEMIYEDSTCLEKDLPISTSIECEATRKFIFKVAKKLLNIPASNSISKKIEVIFNPEKQVTALSVKHIGVLSEQKDATATVQTGATGATGPAEAKVQSGATGPAEATGVPTPSKKATVEATGATKTATVTTGVPTPSKKATVEATGATKTATVQKPTGEKKGGLRQKKRRTIRKK